MTGFTFTNVTHSYQSQNVLRDLSLNVADGEIICLLGISGSGKTTILRLLAGLERPDKGEIFIGQKCVNSPRHLTPPEERNIGFLFQDYALFPHLTVRENVRFGLRYHPAPAPDERVADLLEKAGVAGLADKYADELSGGEQQRVALARALAPAPRLLLMDEPFSNLDVPLRDSIRHLTKTLVKQANATGVIVTHDPNDALSLADRVAIMQKGQVMQIAPPNEAFLHPINYEAAHLLGDINSCKIMKNDVGRQKIFGVETWQDVHIAIRPHLIRRGTPPPETQTQTPIIQFTAHIAALRPYAGYWRGIMRIAPDIEWEFYTRDTASLAVGQESQFHILKDDLMIFPL